MLHLSPKPQVLITLEPGMLVGRVLRGVRVVRTHHASFGQADWAAIWENNLADLDEALGRIVARLGLSPGSEACVVFESAGALAEFQSIGAGGFEATAAARLAAAERLGVSADSACLAVRRLGRAVGEDGRAKTQFIVAGAGENELQKVYRWAERAHLRCRGAVPTSAMMLDALATRLLGWRGDEDLNLCHIDRCRSVVGSGSRRGITMLRTFEVGLTHLCEAVIRAGASLEGGRGGGIAFDRAQAVLIEKGLPQAGQVFDEESGLASRAVLPYLQPVLQRIFVELKQSFRKALREGQDGQVRIEVSGPGATIGGLDVAIARALDAEVVYLNGAMGEQGVSETWADWASDRLLLHTAAEMAERRGRVLRRAAIAGALVAGCVVGAEAMVQAHQISSLKGQIGDNAARVSEVRQFGTMCQSAVRLETQIDTARDLISSFQGDQPAWSALLREIALSAEGKVVLTEIRGVSDEKNASVVIAGLADAAVEPSPLSELIGQLQASALVGEVQVVSRRLIELDDKTSHQFRLQITAQRAPVQQLRAEVEP
ncbi:MAG: hypothetical protein DYG94_09890 [Leptolyngbya sp. PLA3]|nr:MAG: hypothetical protein EDM82_05035 [Cyanobacteria bacterium CYA]MCE7969041.1 hypothetical protein [Leptolyngbya sp. PL-A3]